VIRQADVIESYTLIMFQSKSSVVFGH